MLTVEDVTVRFDGEVALDRVSLDIGDGEIVAVLGPSGCGKSTLLRVVAGLHAPDHGRVVVDGIDQAGREPHERGIGLMFQDHTLFPHRDVGANVAFGLRMARVPAEQRRLRVAELLELVGLDGYERRAVSTLSGGEAQRVALARALAPRPRLLLLDEPLGSLDRALRDRLVDELPALFGRLGISVLHVTHDHDEAFAVADRIVVMSRARVRRVGPPADVWADPRSVDVARFLGHRNIVERDAATRVIRSDAATIDPAGELEVTVTGRRFRRGHHELTVVDADGVELVFELADGPPVGTTTRLALDPARVMPVASVADDGHRDR